MSRIDEVRAAMMAALKSGDRPRKDALSLLLSALKSKQIDKRAELTDDEANAVVYNEIKEAQDTIRLTPAERSDIIDECRFRIAVYSEFAPTRMTEAEISAALDAVLTELGIEAPTAKDKGKIMKAFMPRVKGKADGSLVNSVVSARLN